MRRNMRRGISMRKYMNASRGNNFSQVLFTSGSSGSEVEELQKKLVRIAEEYTSIPVVNITSTYDDLTRKAVTELQKIMGLEMSGNVNKLMLNRINVLSSKNEEDTRDDDYYDSSANVIYEGSKGRMVVDLQKYLNVISTKYPDIPKLNVDGVFGPKTKEAVLKFQELFGLEKDGIVGQITWEALYNVSIGKQVPTVFD